MIKNKLKILFCLFALMSCDSALDINDSPNSPATSTPELTLPTGQVLQGMAIGLDFALVSGFIAQYWTQAAEAGQYELYERYNYGGAQTNPGWVNSWYGAMSDYEFVRVNAIEQSKPNHAAVATLLLAYQYQVLVDLFDSVPFDEALKGKEGNLQPAYQSGQEVYDRIITLIDEGLALIIPGAIVPGTEDLILGGDMEMWEKFGNTLKLRVYMRQSEARPDVASAGIAALESSGALFLGTGEDVFLSYSGSTGNENPLFSGDASTALTGLADNNINASASAVGRFTDANDPRVDFYYDPAVNTGIQVGEVQGQSVEEPTGIVKEDFSTPSDANVHGPTSPVYFMTGHESLLLQAEAVARGWMSGDARSAYNIGVQAAFDFANGGDASAFTTDGGAYEYVGLESIHLQKWLSMAGTQVVEGWAEWRRTDTPQLDQSTEGTAASLNGSKFPRRAFYPIAEISNNPNTPANTNIGDPVWWDVSE